MNPFFSEEGMVGVGQGGFCLGLAVYLPALLRAGHGLWEAQWGGQTDSDDVKPSQELGHPLGVRLLCSGVMPVC